MGWSIHSDRPRVGIGPGKALWFLEAAACVGVERLCVTEWLSGSGTVLIYSICVHATIGLRVRLILWCVDFKWPICVRQYLRVWIRILLFSIWWWIKVWTIFLYVDRSSSHLNSTLPTGYISFIWIQDCFSLTFWVICVITTWTCNNAACRDVSPDEKPGEDPEDSGTTLGFPNRTRGGFCGDGSLGISV